MVVFLFLSLRRTDGTVFQGANSGREVVDFAHEKGTRRCLCVICVAPQACIGCATSFTPSAVQTRAIVSKRGCDVGRRAL